MLLVKCMSTESAQAAKEYLNSKLNSLYSVELEALKLPVIRIMDFENKFKLDQDEIEQDINNRNFPQHTERGKILHISDINEKGTQNIIMEITPDMHKHIKEHRDRLFVGFQNCKVFDNLSERPCYKCGRTGHNGNKCTNTPACLRCAGNHLTKDCKGRNKICCVNCVYCNKKYGKNYNTEHTATDTENCTILKTKINKVINSYDYLVKPTIPRYLGKTDYSNATSTGTSNDNTKNSAQEATLIRQKTMNRFTSRNPAKDGDGS